MKKFGALIVAAAVSAVFAGPVLAEGKVIGVSWSDFAEERWKTDEAAMKKANEELELNVTLSTTPEFGSNYAQIH